MTADGRLVMIVDDDDDIRATLKSILEDEGFLVLEAANGAAALAALAQAETLPEVIFLDLGMPVMNGREFRDRQRADPRLASIPIVVITAIGDSRAKAMALEPRSILPKPFRIEELLEAATPPR